MVQGFNNDLFYYLFSNLVIYYLQETSLASSCDSFDRFRGLLDWGELGVYKSCRNWIGRYRYTVQTTNNVWV